ncbi:Vacuolar protein-sorting-associated protein 27 [Coemansia sp. BCRC 34490]|nr:Vacuolar protein-sorting-associated protein 27 [Coemansia sp. BCRC 34490]
MCIKNGGSLIQLELTKREFIDAIYGLMESKTGRSVELRQLVLKLVQEWSQLFRNNPEMAYVDGVYTRMKRMGYSFPRPEVASSGAMVDSSSAPEWEDSPVCQRCRTQFTFTNRKHHCRHCGKCFCNDCSSNTAAIPKFAIYDPVRVCHGCYLRLKKIVSETDNIPRDPTPVSRRESMIRPPIAPSASASNVDSSDIDLKRAIELSLQEAQHKPNYADYSLDPKIVGNSVPSSQAFPPAQATQQSQSLYPSLSSPWQEPASRYPEVKSEPYPLTSAPTSNPQYSAEGDDDDPDLRAAIEASLRDAPGGSGGGGDLRVPDYLPASGNINQPRLQTVTEQNSDDNKPLAAFMPAAEIAEDTDSGPLSITEKENVQLFESLLIRIRDSGQDIRNDPQVQYLHESIEQLRPKITDAVETVDQKQREFSKLHDRIVTATKIYEQLLDKRLRSSTYTTPNNASTANSAAYQYAQQSIYPTLPSAQQSLYAAPPQTQYASGYSEQRGPQDTHPQHQHTQLGGNPPQGHYSSYNEPGQLSRSVSVYQQPQPQQPQQQQQQQQHYTHAQQLSPNNPFTTSSSGYPEQSAHSTVPAQPYSSVNGPAASNIQQPQIQPQQPLVGPASSARAVYNPHAANNIPSIPPLQPTPVRQADSAQQSTASNTNINASTGGNDINTGANAKTPEPEEALLIEF